MLFVNFLLLEESFLGNTQTLLGTIATLAILCLFVEIRKDDGADANGNFIFQLIAAIGSDVNQNLKKLANKISNKAQNKKVETYKRCGLDKSVIDANIESYLDSLCRKSNRNDLSQKLLSIYKKIDIVERKILDYSEVNILFNGQNQQKFIAYYNKRQEPRLMALMIFLSSMLFLFIDVFKVDVNHSVLFTWFFLFYMIAFSGLIWMNHFSHNYEEKNRDLTRKVCFYIVCGIVNVIIVSMGFVFTLYLPFGYLATILAFLFPISCTFVISTRMYHSYWQTHVYSRTIVLKHIIYITLAAIVGVLIVSLMEAFYPHTEFDDNIQFFREPLYIRYVLFSVLLLDLILVPLYGGYLHMKIDEWRAVRRVNKCVSLYDRQLESAVDELYDVINEIKKIDEPILNK